MAYRHDGADKSFNSPGPVTGHRSSARSTAVREIERLVSFSVTVRGRVQ